MTFKLDLHVLRDFQLSMKAGVTVLGCDERIVVDFALSILQKSRI